MPEEYSHYGLDGLTTNLPFGEWTEVFGSGRLTRALLDRLTHNVHILEMDGDCHRLKHSKGEPFPAKTCPSRGIINRTVNTLSSCSYNLTSLPE